MTAEKLREWRGVKPVAAPSGAAITTRLRTSAQDAAVLVQVAVQVSRLRRRDLAVRSKAGTQTNTDRARRKREMTAGSSSRMAGTILRGNDDQYRLARMAQSRTITDLRSAITVITGRLAAPTRDVAPSEIRQGSRRKSRKAVNGYRHQAERFAKQTRLQVLQARLRVAEADHAAGVVHVVSGGRRLAKSRLDLDAAGMTVAQWRERWQYARDVFEANGSGDEPYGNLTITVTPAGRVSIRLPRALEHLANAPRGRYVLDAACTFRYRANDWRARLAGGNAVSYAFTRRPGRGGWYLTASWATTANAALDPGPVTAGAAGVVAGVDLNDGHLAVRRLDEQGNPVGAPLRIEFALTGTSRRRDAQVRHAVTRLLRWAVRHQVDTIAVEDLNFADARATGRETMGRGRRGKSFRRTVAGIPTAVFRDRLTGMVANTGLRLIAVNPAYTSRWGDQHWRKPYQITRHEAAATVIGRRAQGYRARRREGVTCTRPEDRVARATNQATLRTGRLRDDRQWNRTRGTEARMPHHVGTRSSRRATVAPAPAANNGHRYQ